MDGGCQCIRKKNLFKKKSYVIKINEVKFVKSQFTNCMHSSWVSTDLDPNEPILNIIRLAYFEIFELINHLTYK